MLTLAAAPEPGAAAYSLRVEVGLVRVANNAPWANLRRGESDPGIDAVISRVEHDFRPDLVHVQHLQFLSASWSTRAPVLWTLHDAWAWCAAGGLLLRDGQLHDGRHCAGPGTACAPCASRQARDTPALAQLMGVAGRLSPWIDPPRLHALWRRLPPGWRARALDGPVPPLNPSDLARRDQTVLAFAGRCACILSPSRWLAGEAVRNGLPAPRVLPHGVAPPSGPATSNGVPARRRRDAAATGPFVFLGTLAPHKGPHLVWEAWRRARLRTPLRIIGPDGPDSAYTATFPHEGPVDASAVPALLAGARALVLGSVWPENAPLVVLEARAVGCPVIAPATGGLPELVEPGVDGWLYPPGDTDALAACLRAAEQAGPLPVRPPPTLDAHLDQLGTIYAEILAR